MAVNDTVTIVNLWLNNSQLRSFVLNLLSKILQYYP